MGKGLEIDYEIADKITVCNLSNQRKCLMEELKYHSEGKYLHPEDFLRNAEIIAALELLIPYFGGTND